MNIEDWKVKVVVDDGYYYEEYVVGQVLTCTPAYDPSIVSFKGLDGAFYLQSFGEPTPTVTVTVLSTFNEMNDLNWAQAIGSKFSVRYRENTYNVYLPEKPSWKAEKPGYYYSATLNFMVAVTPPPPPPV